MMQQLTQRTKNLIVRIALLFTITIFSVLLTPTNAYACSCMAPGSPAEEYPHFDAVFSGRVISVVQETPADSFERNVVTIEIDESWKGTDGDEATIYTATSGATCGYYFEAEQSYLVYANAYDNSNPDDIWTNICTRTGLLEGEGEDLIYLHANHVDNTLIRILFAFIASIFE